MWKRKPVCFFDIHTYINIFRSIPFCTIAFSLFICSNLLYNISALFLTFLKLESVCLAELREHKKNEENYAVSLAHIDLAYVSLVFYVFSVPISLSFHFLCYHSHFYHLMITVQRNDCYLCLHLQEQSQMENRSNKQHQEQKEWERKRKRGRKTWKQKRKMKK